MIISSYYNLSKWQKLTSRIEKAKERKVDFTFYVRQPETKNEDENINKIKRIGFTPLEIYRLHAKTYFNESEAIISSMNLNVSSDTSSLDIGVITKSKEEYNDVIRFYEKYVKPNTLENGLGYIAIWKKLENSLRPIFPEVDIREDYGIQLIFAIKNISNGRFKI